MGQLLRFPQPQIRILDVPDVAVNGIARVRPTCRDLDSIKLFTDYLRREKGASENTVSAYLVDLLQFRAWLDSKNLEQAERRDIQEFLAAKMADGLSSRSAARKLSVLRSFYRLLLDEETIQSLPTNGVPIPKTWKALPSFVELSELEKMVRGTESQKGYLAVRDKAILLTLFASGLRESELVSLKLADLDLDAGIVKV